MMVVEKIREDFLAHAKIRVAAANRALGFGKGQTEFCQALQTGIFRRIFWHGGVQLRLAMFCSLQLHVKLRDRMNRKLSGRDLGTYGIRQHPVSLRLCRKSAKELASCIE